MLTIIYCKVDDFCKHNLDKMAAQKLLGNSKSKNNCIMTVSEIVTIAIYYHHSGYKTFKDYYTREVLKHLTIEFPNLVSYGRMVELKQKIGPVLIMLQQAALKGCTGISIIDSTSLAVCKAKRIYQHKTFKNFAQRGKTSIGWFFGFKLHAIINHIGEIISIFITPGNVADNNKEVIKDVTKNIFGKLVGDKGYIGLFEDLFKRNIQLIHGLRKKMKNKLMTLFDKKLLRKRSLVETVFGILKDSLGLEHSRHRSLKAFGNHLLTTVLAYAFKEKKPIMNLAETVILLN